MEAATSEAHIYYSQIQAVIIGGGLQPTSAKYMQVYLHAARNPPLRHPDDMCMYLRIWLVACNLVFDFYESPTMIMMIFTIALRTSAAQAAPATAESAAEAHRNCGYSCSTSNYILADMYIYIYILHYNVL